MIGFLITGALFAWILCSIEDWGESSNFETKKWNFFKIVALPFIFIVQQTKSFVNLWNLSDVEKEIREKEREIEELKRQKKSMKRLKKLEQELKELFEEVEVE